MKSFATKVKKARPSGRLLLGVCLFGSVVTALLGPGVAGRLRHVGQYALAPLGDVPMYLAFAFRGHTGRTGRRLISQDEAHRLKKANNQLFSRLAELEQRCNRLRHDLAEIQKVRPLYGPKSGFPCELIPARVVTADPLPYGWTYVLRLPGFYRPRPGSRVITRLDVLTDRTKALPSSLAVVTSQAMVGRIIEAGAFTARVQLVADRGFRITAKIRRVIHPHNRRQITVTGSGAAALVQLRPENNQPIDVEAVGDGAGGMIIHHVSANHNVLPGDWLVTRREDAFLPAEVRIGKVVRVTDDPKHPGLFVSVRIQPWADLDALREMYVVLPLEFASEKGTDRGSK
ncbi:MAG: rod shape-determining protein MreC [Planctomycetota bacterium]|nr:rod shape-determining protein MreC [Planctomycetota bacterium]